MEPGTARGLVYLASAALAFESGFSSVGAGTASFIAAATGFGGPVGVFAGSLFFGFAYYDAELSITYYRKAQVDFSR